MITGLKISNFRSIEGQAIQLRPITVVYGPNGAGKSSLLYAMAVLRNIFQNPNQSVDSFFNLGFANIGSFEQVVFDHRTNLQIELSAELRPTASFPYGPRYKATLSKSEGKLSIELSVPKGIEPRSPKVTLSVSPTFPYPVNMEDKQTIDIQGSTFDIAWNGIQSKLLSIGENASDEAVKQAEELVQLLNQPTRLFSAVEMIPLRRGFTKPHYTIVGQTPTLITEDEVSTYLATNKYLVGKVSNYLEELFKREFRINFTPGTAMFTLDVTDKTCAVTTELMNDGFGVNQVLYLIAKCLRQDVRTVCIEEPEIHLHPTAVTHLARVFVRMMKEEEKQFIISTHSEALVLSLLALVSKQDLTPEDICLYLVQKTEKKTNFEMQRVAADGQVEGGLGSFLRGEVELLKAFSTNK